jgi:hypothetical protein
MNIVCRDKSDKSNNQGALIARANRCYLCEDCTYVVLRNQPGFIKLMCNKVPGRIIYVPISSIDLTF